MLIKKSRITLNLVKIKGHSEIEGNDIANELAKKGRKGKNNF